MTEQNGTPATWHGVPRPEGLDEALNHARAQLGTAEGAAEPQDLETVPEHSNDLGDWCPSSGDLTADGTCPQYCRQADELVGFDAGERDGDEDDPAEIRAEPCVTCTVVPTVATSLAGERMCQQHAEAEAVDCGVTWDEDEGPDEDPAEVSPEREDAAVDRWEARQADAAQAVRRCAYCGHLGDLEPVNAGPSVACVNTVLCMLRQQSQDPPAHLVTVALAMVKDVTRLTEIELARLITGLKRAVVAAEVELGSNRDRARGDAALAQAAGELAPRH